jgi:hypothetical protein
MDDSTARRRADELVRIVTSVVRECWEAYALQFRDDERPRPEAVDAILARSVYPILAKLEEVPPEIMPMLLPHVVRTMLTAFLQVIQTEVGREHRRMLDTLEAEALKFAERAGRAIDDARQARDRDVARLQAEVDRLRRELRQAPP